MVLKIENPTTLASPIGRYSHLSRASRGEMVFIAGQISIDQDGNLVGKNDFRAQMRQVFMNLRAALEHVNGSFAEVAKYNSYLSRSSDLADFHSVRSELFEEFYPDGKYPPNTLLVVDRLVSDDFLLEVEAVVVVGT